MRGTSAKWKLIIAVFIFGTVGIFVRNIPMPSAVIAFWRGIIGALFLTAFMLLTGKKPDFSAIRKKLLPLCVSGAMIGFNWILLFEAYRFTTVPVATLCYYLAPIIVVIVSPVVLKERLTAKKLICVLTALLGMVFVSGVIRGGLPAPSEGKGILLGIGAAVLYGSIILVNQSLGDVPAYDKTIVQLLVAAVTVFPYCLLTGGFAAVTMELKPVLLLIFVGIFNTGFAYTLYFGSMNRIPAQSVAIIGYIDPVVAVLLSALLLHETLDVYGIIGAVLILGAAFVSEMPSKR